MGLLGNANQQTGNQNIGQKKNRKKCSFLKIMEILKTKGDMVTKLIYM